MTSEQQNKYCESTDISQWNLEINNSVYQENCCSDENCQGRSLTNSSLYIHRKINLPSLRFLLPFKAAKGVAPDTVSTTFPQPPFGTVKSVILPVKEIKRKTSGCQCRVHNIVHTAKKLFYN